MKIKHGIKVGDQQQSKLFTKDDIKKAIEKEGMVFKELPVPMEPKKDMVLNMHAPTANLEMNDGNIVSVYIYSSLKQQQFSIKRYEAADLQ
ncbi:hypothetical protein SAMN04487897_12132 [Paenibacillus sp. yr247]|uniref:hypothetical protein n=1 Tax=Paenibacillus sp. yr247 TaxID=1761880 RepID=UPI000886DB50|nr:hypothetical protein [Paenibacillus sp. yr247]SDO75143.1 hypothetical protein SAMN04487897_12132 [Paenibacillus sp. yr247]